MTKTCIIMLRCWSLSYVITFCIMFEVLFYLNYQTVWYL